MSFLSLLARPSYCSDKSNNVGQKIPQALNNLISVDLYNVSYEKALDVIAESAGVKFNFNRSRIDLNAPVTVIREHAPAIEALSSVLEQTNTTMEITAEGQIAIIPVSNKGNTKGAITGRIFDKQTGENIIGASVELMGHKRGAVSDIYGMFRIPRITLGTYNLKIRCIGYDAKIIESVTIGDSSDIFLDIPLVSRPLELKEVTVTPGTFSIMESESAVSQSLSRDDIETVSQIGEDIYRAVNRLPGLSTNDYSAKFKVRGGEHDEVAVLLDGLELYEPFHVKDINEGVISIIDAEAVEGIDLITGGFTSEYGNYMSGVFNINTREPENDNRSYSLGLSMMNLRLMSKGTFKNNRGAWFVSARRGYFDLILDLINEEQAPKPKYYDILMTTRYNLAPGQTLKLGLLHAGDKMYQLEEEDDNDHELLDSEYGNSYVWASLNSLINKRLFIKSQISLGNISRKRYGYSTFWEDHIEKNEFLVKENRDFNLATLKQDWQYELSEKSLLKWGMQYKTLSTDYDYYSYRYLETQIDSINFDEDSVVIANDFGHNGYSYGTYLSNRLEILKPLVIELGLRYDRHSYSKDNDISPRVNGMFKLADKTILRWGWGKFYQPQRIDQLNIEDGNINYGHSELAEHWTLGLEHLLLNKILFRIEGYYKDYSHLRPSYRNWDSNIDYFPEVKEERFEVFLNSRISKGMEIYLKKDNGGKFSFWASYALAYTEDKIDSIHFAENSPIVPYGITTQSPNDQRHTFHCDINYRPRPSWTINLSWSYHTGWPFTGKHIETTYISPDSSAYAIEPDSLYSSRYPAFHRLNLRLTKNIATKNGHVRFFLELINLYNHDNVFAHDWRDIEFDNQGRPYIETLKECWFHLMPSIGVSWSGNF